MATPPAHPAATGPVGRRSLLWGASSVLIWATGCSNGTKAPSSTGTSGTTGPQTASTTAAPSTSATSTAAPTSSTATSAPPSATLPATAPWRPGAGEIEPAAKRSAVTLIEALGSWRAGQAGERRAAARAAALGIPAPLAGQLASQAGSLLGPGDEARLQVIDAQYGGLLTDTASVLVVCRQWSRNGAGAVIDGGTTVDVRLSRTGSGWSVTALHPAVSEPAAPSPTASTRAVLARSAIELPPAAAADIRSGTVHDSVLQAMLRLADTYRMSVSVVRSGHPLDVFGTSRPSDHPVGRAFDVWRINGHPVVDPATPRALITAFMRAAAAAGSYNVGGPVLLTGGVTSNQFFSDDTHHDHVHIGFPS
ncbi:hypothetical protein [Streptomyces sp. RKAG293]|uniref:hypothetical protein n=1 Tax=Streptomyces sp. RKAG293 TaxID=2893403 RepID=UPI0020343E45|nr:hypothetical protein [Streptomyces sp. RKAG293]MCM2417201.1 hypothetical protein [Streptomyces sp. RKAG293]